MERWVERTSSISDSTFLSDLGSHDINQTLDVEGLCRRFLDRVIDLKDAGGWQAA
jgi:hypothetical protein